MLRFGAENKSLIAIASACLISAWYLLVLLNTSHAPRADDFDIVLNTLVQTVDSNSYSEKFAALFSVHNEHRPALIRLIAFALYKGFGNVNFVLLTAIGNMFFIFLVLLLYEASSAKAGLAFLPVLLILFNLQHFDTATWASLAVCHYGFLFFSALAIFLSYSERKIVFALCFISISITALCLGGAVIAAMVCLALQAYLKRPVRAVLMIIFIIGLIVLNYLVSQKSSAGLLTGDPGEILTFFFLFLGSFFSINTVHLLSPLAGQILFFCLCYITFLKKGYESNLRLYSVFLFLTTLAAVVSIFRSHYGLPEAISSRYKIYSLLTLATAYLTFLEVVSEKQRKRFILAAICISAAFFVFVNCRYYPAMVFSKEAYDSKLQGWISARKKLDYPDFERAERILIEATSRGIYKAQ